MRIIGVDPGTLTTGYGIVDFSRGELEYISSGTINISSKKEMPFRLKQISDELILLINKYKPDEFSLETAFYDKNIQSTLKIGYVRGISMLTAVNMKLEIREYSPREIKKSIVGNGAASKEQVQFMIKKLLDLRKPKMKFDETDALAVAICHAFKSTTAVKKGKSWKDFIAANPDRVMG
ncbi:MAG: crossover junction endodeoxyribonuclease RuvC [Melioribacteraceae bacterium]|jgi:crossover junction endodeoxyribonuclease RuvC|nr:crossover junction endodeoxyribonuclease RuvC [Melioribacteraceae bacterium]